MPNQTLDSRAGRAKNRVPLCWHMITCEFPPQIGGVSDYTYLLASRLAARDDEVHVWCPGSSGTEIETTGVVVHRTFGRFTPADLRHVGQQLDRFPLQRRILVQWVPHGYGYRAMNLAFCGWLWNRAAKHGDHVEIMLHEPYLPFSGRSWRQNVAALVQRIMTVVLLRAARRVWMSIPAWENRWRPYAFGRNLPFEWLPIPSGIPATAQASGIQTVRRRYTETNSFLAGHFGTYGWPTTSVLKPILLALASAPANEIILLIGAGGQGFRDELVAKEPRLGALVQATGALNADDLSCHIAACDILIQPYPDGLSSRRTSLMAGLCHGKPVVSTSGPLSEPFWKDTNALAIAPVGDSEAFVRLIRALQADGTERSRMGRAARALYEERFDISHTVTALRKAANQLSYSA